MCARSGPRSPSLPSRSPRSRRNATARRLPTSTSGTSPTSIPRGARGAPPRTSSPPSFPSCAVTRASSAVGRSWPPRSRTCTRQPGPGKLYTYANLLADQDTRIATHQGMMPGDAAAGRGVLGAGRLHRAGGAQDWQATRSTTFVADEKRLATYRFYLTDIARRAEHTLSDNEERLLADAGRWPARRQHLRHPLQRRLPLPDDHAEGRHDRQGRPGGVQRAAGERRAATTGKRRCRRSSRRSAASAAPTARPRTPTCRRSIFYAKARKYPSNLAMALNGPTSPPPSTRAWWTASTATCRPSTAISRCASTCSASASCTTTTSTRRWCRR